MALFTESGTGRKQCPGCQMYNGVRAAKCENCNREFTSADKKVRAVNANFYEEGGLGRKPCPCGKFVGVRSASCPACGHDFKADRRDEAAEPRTIDAAPIVQVVGVNKVVPIPMGLEGGVILTPSGPCPFKLESTETAAVEQWAGNVTAHYRRLGRQLDPSALRYFAGTFFKPHTPEHVDVITTLSLL
jgi:hypothetical protein